MSKRKKGALTNASPTANLYYDYGDKDKHYTTDYQKVYDEFSSGILTMIQVTVNTRIPTQYICRYVGMFKKMGLIQIHHIGRCPVTGMDGVQFLTCNASLFRSLPKQFDLFENEQS